MISRRVWLGRPIIRKLAGLNLPTEVEVAFVEHASEKLAATDEGSEGSLVVEASFPCGTGGWYDCYGWIAYISQDGVCVVTDLGLEFIQQA
jgi:hypothetical protein